MHLRSSSTKDAPPRTAGSGPEWARHFARFSTYIAAACLLLFAADYAREAFLKHASFIHDDAFITMRYARHVASGEGFVWNPGERVEGYTSFMAVLLIAVVHGLGLDLIDAALAVNLVGFAGFVLALGAFAWLQSSRGALGFLLASIPSALALTCVSVIIWVLGRLEAPLFLGFVSIALVAMLCLLKEPHRRGWIVAAGLCLGLLPLVRPEGALFGAVAAFAFVVPCLRSGRRGLDSFGLFALAGILPTLAQLAFRLAYYGAWVPNTVLAKTTGLEVVGLQDFGFRYLWDFLQAPPYLPAVALALLPCALLLRSNRIQVLYLLASLVTFAAMITWVGGDHMPHSRLLLPVLPCALLLIFYALLGVSEQLSRFAATAQLAITGVCVVGVLLLIPRQNAFEPMRTDAAAFVGTITGRYLRENFPAGTLVALNTAGSTPFFAPNLLFIDMLGLNDAHIAKREITQLRLRWQTVPGHSKGDGRYVLEREPDLIIVGPAEGTEATHPWFLSDLELMELPQFHARYEIHRTIIDVREISGYEFFPATRRGFMTLTYYEKVSRKG